MTTQDSLFLLRQGNFFADELRRIIQNDLIAKEFLKTCELYYRNENDIKRKTLATSLILENLNYSKNSHPYLENFITQAVNYSLGKPVNKKFVKENDEKTFNENIDIKTFNLTLKRLMINSRLKGTSWLYCYAENIDGKSKFKFKIIPTEQIIPIYRDGFGDEIQAIIRYYDFFDNDIKYTRVEYWFILDGVVYKEDWNLTDKNATCINPYTEYIANNQILDYTLFPHLPFVQFKNNYKGIPDLQFIKDMIDKIDNIDSAEANDVERLYFTFLKIKGYSGTKKENLSEYIQQLHEIGAVLIDPDGDIFRDVASVSNIYGEILNKAEERLYSLAKAVNITKDGLGNTSGTALKMMFAPLELKCTQTETEYQESLDYFVELFNDFLELNNISKIESPDFEFTHEMMFNELENAQTKQIETNTAMMLKGTIPEKRVIEMLPQEFDSDKIISELEEERLNNLSNTGIDSV